MATEKLRIELQAITAKAEKDIRRFQGSVNKAAKAVQMLGSSGKRSMRPLGEGLSAASVNASEFEKSMAAANARVIAFGASAGLIYQVQRALKETVKATIEVEKSFANINIVLNASQATLQKFGNTLFTIAGQTGQSFRDVSEAATELARQGLSMEKTLSRTKDALILTRLTGMGAVESVESLTAAVNSFSSAGVTSAQVINKMAKVDQAFAVSSEDLAKSIARVGSSAVDAGVSLDQLLAITTAVQQRTARGGAVIGNAFKTIFTRIGRTDVQQKLAAIGVATRDMQGNMLGATQVLQNLSDKFKDLSRNQQNQIAESVAGVFQVNILRAALGDLSNKYGVYNKALLDSATATDEAYKKNEQLNKTLDSLVNKTLANLTKAGSGIGELTLKPALEKVLGSVNEVIESFGEGGRFEKFGQGMGKEILEGLGRFISGPGLAIGAIAIGKLLYNFSKFAKQAVGGIMELNANVANRKNLEALVTQELLKQPDIIARIERGQSTVEKEAADILSLYKRQNTEAEKLKMTTAAIAGEMAAINRSRVAGGGGRAGGSRFGRRRASGFIPNFASEDQERIEASLGGYQAGAIKKMTIPGEGPVLYNSAETVKRFPGMTQPAIMPPEDSRAGTAYKTSFSDAHGFDPYKGQGFIPNFLPARNTVQLRGGLVGGGRAGAVPQKKAISVGASVRGDKYGTINLFGESGTSTFSADYKDITGLNIPTGLPAAKSLAKSRLYVTGIQNKSFLGEAKEREKNNKFSKLIRSHLSEPFTNLVNDFSQSILGLGNDSPKVQKISRTGNALFPAGAEGSIFESTIRAMTKDKKLFEDSLGGTDNAIWDFEETGKASSTLIDAFGFSSGLRKADAKRTLDSKQKTSILNKIINTHRQKGSVGKSTQISKFLEDLDSQVASLTSRNRRRKALGFVPSFSSAISEAIEREKSAGIPSSSIRIGSDSRLSSKANPMGLGVYNTKDEPAGLGQGIDRSIRIGQDPKTHGAAKGFVPNFMIQHHIAKGVVKTGLLTKAFEKLTKVASKAAGAVAKHGKASIDSLRNPNGMGLMGVSMLAQQGTGGGSNAMNAVMEGVSWGTSVGMINPILGVFTGLGVAAYKFSTAAEEQIDVTQAAENALSLLSAAQEKTSQKFQQIKVDLENLGDVDISLGKLDQVVEDLLKLSENAKDSGISPSFETERIENLLKADDLDYKQVRGLSSQLMDSLNSDAAKKEQDIKLTEKIENSKLKQRKVKYEYHDFSDEANINRTETRLAPDGSFEGGLSSGSLQSLLEQKVFEKYSKNPKGGAAALQSFKQDFGNFTRLMQMPLPDNLSEDQQKEYLKSQKRLMQDRAFDMFGIGEESFNSFLKKGKAFADGDKGAINRDKINTDLEGLSEIFRRMFASLLYDKNPTENRLYSKAQDFSNRQMALDEKEKNKKIAKENFFNTRVQNIALAKQNLLLAQAKEDKTVSEAKRDKNIILQNADMRKKRLMSRAQSSMSTSGLAEAGFKAQKEYIEEYERESRTSLTTVSAAKARTLSASFEEKAKNDLASNPFFNELENKAVYDEQIKAISDFTEKLKFAAEDLESGALTPETEKELLDAQSRAKSVILSEENDPSEGSKILVDFNRGLDGSVDEILKLNRQLNQQNLDLGVQIEGMNNLNDLEKRTKKEQLENARIFNKQLRDEQQETIYILAKQKADEANLLSSQGRITATQAARLKANELEYRRDRYGMKDIVSESKESASIGIQESLGYNQRDFVNDIQSSFKEIGDTFKSGMADAIKGMVTGATDFKSAMASVFGTIADKTADKGIEMGINAMMNAGMNMFKKSSGGPIKKYQTGGLVTGGSGVKDDVLTMMQGGEYVIRKSAVNQIPGGVSTLDAINRSAGGEMPRFAAGGSANLSLKRDFKYTGKDKKRPTGGHFDVDSRMSTLGFFGAQGTKTDMFDRQKRLESYKDYVAQEKKRRADIIAKDLAERKGRLMKAYTSAAMAIAGQAISGAMQGQGDSFDITKTGNPNIDGSVLKPSEFKFSLNSGSTGFASGGQAHGRIPGMVMGGEYIMSPQATQQYGSGFMAQLNRGQLPGFAEGGLVGGEKAGSEDEESKAKETSSTTNNVNISISIDKTGNAETSEGESASEGQNDEDVTKSKEFSQAIKTAVLEEIVKQQRPGGLLRDNDSKG